MAKIIVVINPQTGQATVKPEGYVGPVCKEKTRPFLQRLGMVVNDEETSEMYVTQDQNQNQNQQ